MTALCQLLGMQLLKEVKSKPKKPSYKKVCSPQEGMVKKM